jgi:hypothetical protein
LVLTAFQARALAFGVQLSVESTLLVVPVVTLLTLIPLSPGGLGTQEAFSTLVLTMIGINSTTALAMALVARLLEIVLALVGALIWLGE